MTGTLSIHTLSSCLEYYSRISIEDDKLRNPWRSQIILANILSSFRKQLPTARRCFDLDLRCRHRCCWLYFVGNRKQRYPTILHCRWLLCSPLRSSVTILGFCGVCGWPWYESGKILRLCSWKTSSSEINPNWMLFNTYGWQRLWLAGNAKTGMWQTFALQTNGIQWKWKTLQWMENARSHFQLVRAELSALIM